MIQRKDILTVPISDEMRAGANEYASATAKLNTSRRVRSISKHDYYGNIGHRAVELLFDGRNLQYSSDASPRKTPDDYDILFAGDRIDVKSTHRNNYDIDKWWKYQKFLVFEHQVNRGILQKKDSIVFCVVDDKESTTYIFGAILVTDFIKKAKKVGPDTNPNLKWENREISIYHLKPFWKFMLRA